MATSVDFHPISVSVFRIPGGAIEVRVTSFDARFVLVLDSTIPMRGLVDVRFTVNLAELKRAVRRLTMRLGDESAIDERFVIFRVALKRLTIETVNSSEELSVEVHQPGTVNVPVAVFCAIAKTLRYHGRRQVQFSISSGSIGVDRTVTRHPGISVN